MPIDDEVLVGGIGEKTRGHRHDRPGRIGEVTLDALAQDSFVLPVRRSIHRVRVDDFIAVVIAPDLEAAIVVARETVERPFRDDHVEDRKRSDLKERRPKRLSHHCKNDFANCPVRDEC